MIIIIRCNDRSTTGVWKCEACVGGCQVYDAVPKANYVNIGNERTRYDTLGGAGDTILYRSGKMPALYASTRGEMKTQVAWGVPTLTNIPNDESNINAGTLPDGRIWLLSNAVFRAKNDSSRYTTATTQAGAGGEFYFYREYD